MKKKFTTLTSIFLSIILIISFSVSAFAATSNPLDEISYYEVKIDPRSDGTLDMKYKIDWVVLDSEKEGPLEWIKIGIPSSHVDEIVGISDNIKEIRYYNEGSNDYVRIDLDRDYLAGEKLTLEFSIHQSHMYIIEEENNLLRYSFTAGWFPEIEVKQIKILWNSKNVLEATSAKKNSDSYYEWTSSLAMDEKFNVSVKYNLDVFDYNLEEQYEEKDSSIDGSIIFLIIFVIALLLIICLCVSLSDYDGGYGGSSHSSVFIHSSCASSCACVSSCACACACAGGGRAGCTKKDFYHTSLSSDDINEVIENL